MNKILIVGYGSIGKRHARNLIQLGIKPYILTNHPDRLKAYFFRDIKMVPKKIDHCIIASATARHLNDFRKCLYHLTGVKNILIEKPLESTSLRASRIVDMAKNKKLKTFVGYNLRFMSIFDIIDKFVQKQKNKIKIVEVVAGQDLREWRPKRKLSQSYSAHRELGGGVDLDLSHELDYILRLFGPQFTHKYIYRTQISSLNIKSPDIFKLILVYKKFIVDITLDYIRKPKERYLKILCEDGHNLFYDFISNELMVNNRIVSYKDTLDNSYKIMLRAFLGYDTEERNKFCTLKDALNILRLLEV